MAIGVNLRRYRRSRGLSQEQLAQLASVSAPYISQIETGRNPTPSAVVVAKLASALGLSSEDLLGDRGSRTLERLLMHSHARGWAGSETRMLANITIKGQRAQTEEDWDRVYEAISKALRVRRAGTSGPSSDAGKEGSNA